MVTKRAGDPEDQVVPRLVGEEERRRSLEEHAGIFEVLDDHRTIL